MRWEQTVEAKEVALVVGESGSLVPAGRVNQAESSERNRLLVHVPAFDSIILANSWRAFVMV